MRCYHKLVGGRWVPTPGEMDGGGGGGGMSGRDYAMASEEREGDRPDSAARRVRAAERKAKRAADQAQRRKNQEGWEKYRAKQASAGGAAQYKKDLAAARAFLKGGG